MGNLLLHATLSNVLMSAVLALIAWTVQRRFRSATIANLLWCLVLVKMVTPPLLAIPVLEIPSVSTMSVSQQAAPSPVVSTFHGETPETQRRSVQSAPSPTSSLASIAQAPVASGTFASRHLLAATVTWLVVSILLFAASSLRIIRFHWLLRASSVVDHQLTATCSAEVAKQFGVRCVPKIIVTPANIAPFVWWMAGRAVIVVSGRAIDELSEGDLRLVMTHEMAHIKRRDHWFRWLEWITLVAFWWNPVVWLARQQLRISEEMACDELVLQQPTSELNQYANSLLNVAELLASSAIRPPILASAINSGGNLEERLKTMMTRKSKTVSSVLRLAIVAVAAGILPLGFVYAHDDDAVEQQSTGQISKQAEHVHHGDLTEHLHRHIEHKANTESAKQTTALIEEHAEHVRQLHRVEMEANHHRQKAHKAEAQAAKLTKDKKDLIAKERDKRLREIYSTEAAKHSHANTVEKGKTKTAEQAKALVEKRNRLIHELHRIQAEQAKAQVEKRNRLIHELHRIQAEQAKAQVEERNRFIHKLHRIEAEMDRHTHTAGKDDAGVAKRMKAQLEELAKRLEESHRTKVENQSHKHTTEKSYGELAQRVAMLRQMLEGTRQAVQKSDAEAETAVAADEDKAKAKEAKQAYGYGVIVGPDGKKKEFVLGNMKASDDALKNLPAKVREQIKKSMSDADKSGLGRGIMTKSNGEAIEIELGDRSQLKKALKYLPNEARKIVEQAIESASQSAPDSIRTHGKMVVIKTDGATQEYSFGDGTDGKDAEEMEINRKNILMRIKGASKKQKATESDDASLSQSDKLDLILKRLDHLEQEIQPLKKSQ